LIHSRNGNGLANMNSQSHSVEKANVSRSRNNKSRHLMQNHTVGAAAGQYPLSKFDGNLLDMNFKTTSSTSNQQSKNASATGAANTSFALSQKPSTSATNN